MITSLMHGRLVTMGAGLAALLLAGSAYASGPAADPDGYIREVFATESPEQALAVTHDGDKPIPAHPDGVGLLTDAKIRKGFMLLVKFNNAAGEVVGYGSEQEVVRDESSIMTGRMIMDTTWTVTLPGRGTIFLSEVEDASEFAKKAVIPALKEGKDWTTPWTFITTVGPKDGKGVVVGGTGEFAGVTGTFTEVTKLRRYTSKKGLYATVELHLSYRK
jgi:hypothetical protein